VDILIEQKAKVFGDFDDVFDVYDLLELWMKDALVDPMPMQRCNEEIFDRSGVRWCFW
jgi:hypothetical protein